MTRTKRTLRLFPIAVLILSLTLLSSPTIAQNNKPNAPALIAATPAGNSIQVSWNAVSEAVRYELMVWWNPLPDWQRIQDNNITGTSWTHTGLTAGTEYYYTIRSVNAAGDKSGWQQTFVKATAQEGSAPAATATPEPTALATVTPSPTPEPTPTLEWCRVAQENTIQGGTLSKYRTLFPNAQAPSFPNIVEVWNSGNRTVVMYELDGFYRHSDGRAGYIWGIEYYSACTYIESRIWFVPFSWHGGDIITLMRYNLDHKDQH